MPKPIPALNHVKFCPHGPARYCTAAGKIMILIFCNIVNQPFGSLPPKTGIGNGFPVDTAPDFLAAFLDIAFDHDPLYQTVNIFVQPAAVHNLLYNPYLLFKLFV